MVAIPTATRHGLVVLLSIASGFADALGYVGLGRVFTANMAGNTMLLGLAIGQVATTLRSVAALVGFVLGVVLGTVLGKTLGARPRDMSLWPERVTAALACECLVLLAFTLWGACLPLPAQRAGRRMR